MRTRIASLAALLALVLSVAPATAITKGGVPDAGEHPMVGQLVFYVPDALPSPYPDPGGWFSCSGTLLSGTVVVTAGHCTFAIGEDGVSTTTEDNRFTAEDGNGSGGNDVWFTLTEDGSQWDGWPLTFDDERQPQLPDPAGPLRGPQRLPQRRRRLGARDLVPASRCTTTGRSTSTTPASSSSTRPRTARSARSRPRTTSSATPGARNEHRFEVVGYGLREGPTRSSTSAATPG